MGSQNSKTSKSKKSENTKTKNLNMTNSSENVTLPIVGAESIMSKKKHGTSETPVQKDLRWGCDWDTADRICNFNVSIIVCGCCVYLGHCSVPTLTRFLPNTNVKKYIGSVITQNTLAIFNKQNFLLKR
jgi:hypothetical protein